MSDRALAVSPRAVRAWTSASSRPWVIHTSEAPVRAMVSISSGQSAWSETTSGSSTRRWRARAQLGRRAHDEGALQCLSRHAGDRGEPAERDALPLIEGAELLEGTVEID